MMTRKSLRIARTSSLMEIYLKRWILQKTSSTESSSPKPTQNRKARGEMVSLLIAREIGTLVMCPVIPTTTMLRTWMIVIRLMTKSPSRLVGRGLKSFPM